MIFVAAQENGTSRPIAFRNTLDYDANFVKVMVLTGLSNKHTPTKATPLGKKKRTFGTNLPGPRIAYHTTKPDGGYRNSTSVQIPQSSYFALHLPYTIFGLGLYYKLLSVRHKYRCNPSTSISIIHENQ